FDKVEPVYEKLPGWKTSTSAVTSYEDLPPKAKDYLSYLSQRVGVEVGCVSVGPDRNQTMFVPGSRMVKLLA
ncbi:MAG: adenylosuccinate synthetase, partial [Bryobacteraceae bacterium]